MAGLNPGDEDSEAVDLNDYVASDYEPDAYVDGYEESYELDLLTN